jgi:DnaJ-class molecular chaperone
MSNRDYYEILDVSKGATADEIRTAHRRLVRKLHPDVNKESDASARFAEVQEAYDVLSDGEKRSRYDRLGHSGVSGQTGGGPQQGGGAWSDVDPETFENIFGGFFRGQGGSAPGQGNFGGGGPDFSGFSGGGASRQPRKRRGADLEHEITVPFMTAALGGTETIRLAGGDGSVQSIEVKVPAGISTGATLRVRGKGNPGASGGASGDLRLRVQVGPHPWFRREGLDLFLDVPISIAEAALGASVQLPLLKGSVTVRVPETTSSGAKLRVPAKGITDSSGKSGDFFALISISAPPDLSEENREQLEAMRASLPDPRAGLSWAEVQDS